LKELSSVALSDDDVKFEAKFAALGVGLFFALLFFLFYLSFLSFWIPDCVVKQARNLLCSQSYVLLWID
jgi:hypothetical protein